MFTEGDVNHPADFEYAACFDESGYMALLAKYGKFADVINKYTVQKKDDYIISYGKMRTDNGDGRMDDLIREIRANDIYDGLPLEKHCRLLIDNWADFAEKAEQTDGIYIFECCFIQNPVTVMLGRHNAPKQAIIDHVTEVYQKIKKLHPAVIYYHQSDMKATIERAAKERPPEWLDGITWYFTEQGYGKANGLEGFAGLIEVLQVRKTIEMELLRSLPADTLLVDNSDRDWSRSLDEIRRFLDGKI